MNFYLPKRRKGLRGGLNQGESLNLSFAIFAMNPLLPGFLAALLSYSCFLQFLE